jgi:hypothetical protein
VGLENAGREIFSTKVACGVSNGYFILRKLTLEVQWVLPMKYGLVTGLMVASHLAIRQPQDTSTSHSTGTSPQYHASRIGH